MTRKKTMMMVLRLQPPVENRLTQRQFIVTSSCTFHRAQLHRDSLTNHLRLHLLKRLCIYTNYFTSEWLAAAPRGCTFAAVCNCSSPSPAVAFLHPASPYLPSLSGGKMKKRRKSKKQKWYCVNLASGEDDRRDVPKHNAERCFPLLTNGHC